MNAPPKHLAAAIELLDYPDADGLHPNEKHWREVARWLLSQARRDEAYADQLRYVWDNIASEVYAFSECHCDVPAGNTLCAYCASEHFCNWFRAQPDLLSLYENLAKPNRP